MKKEITMRMQVHSTASAFDLCSFIEKVLTDSVLSNAEYGLEIIETKVTKETKEEDERDTNRSDSSVS